MTALNRITPLVRHPLLLALAASALAASPARAQMGEGDGFLFRVPSLRLSLGGGYASPRAKSDIFDFVTNELTLEKRDFASPMALASATVRVAPRVEVGFSSSVAGRRANSESRQYTGEDDLPIKQSTSLMRATAMAVTRVSLVAPGHSVGRYAWIPTRVVPYVGAGGGGVWYRLRQSGEFVEKPSLDIFEDTFESSGWSLGATGFGGADFAITPRAGISAEARYLWAKGGMNRDFDSFNRIDLSGYDASIGFYIRF